MGNTSGVRSMEQVRARSFKKFEDPTGVKSKPTENGNTLQPFQSRPEFLKKLSIALSSKGSSEKDVSRSTFVKDLFNDNFLGHLLFSQLCFLSKLECAYEMPYEKFLDSCELALEMHTKEKIIEFYCQMFAGEDKPFDMDKLSTFIYSCYYCAINTYPNFDLDNIELDSYLTALVESILHGKTLVSQGFVKNWIKKHIPNICVAIHTLIVDVLTTGYSKLGTATANTGMCSWDMTPCVITLADIPSPLKWTLYCSLPLLYSSTSSVPSKSDGSQALSTMALAVLQTTSPFCMMDDCAPKSKIPLLFTFQWTLLYDSDVNGLSLNRFETMCFNYRGPWVMIISSIEKQQFCVAADTGWKESCRCWGGQGCSLMELFPHFSVVETGEEMIYFNSKFRGHPLGIMVGCEPNRPIFKVHHDFSKIEFKGIPYRLGRIQVYGCGSEEVKQNQIKQMNWERKQAHKNRTINLEKLNWDENPDKYLLDLTRSSIGNAR